MTQPIDTVLIGTPLDEASDAMVAQAVALARQAGAQAHLAHAFELPLLVPGPYFTAPPATVDFAELDRALEEAMQRQIARLRLGEGGPVFPHIARGAAHRVLSELACEVGAGLMVVGAARSHFPRLLGSTAYRVVRKSECPVLVLRAALPLPPRRVLMPVDLSWIAAEVVERGLDLLERLGARAADGKIVSGIAIEALHAVVPFDLEVFAPRFLPEAAKRKAVENLDRFLRTRHLEDGWDIARRAAFGSAHEEILRRSEEWAPDLVILGTHGYGGFERYLLGSVAEAVVRGCTTNVLVIPPPAVHPARQRLERQEEAAPPPPAVRSPATAGAALAHP
jgi:nucleotide-binding universal stress UspA family protein